MARASRHYIAGQVWHITHRCHKKEFLLKFSKDRKRWHYWLFEAKKRFGLRVLNFVVTSNHIHLLVIDSGEDVIPKSIQLIAGRIGQEFNQRKERKGAFWEDRYHATAIDRNEYLLRCLVYIDLNMVRAGVVRHPAEWDVCGYNDIHDPPERYSVIDRPGLLQLCGFADWDKFCEQHRQWIEAAIGNGSLRESSWTESIAVGSPAFIEAAKVSLGIKAKGRKAEIHDGRLVLREDETPYNALFTPEKRPLSPENAFFWDDCRLVTDS